MTNITTGDRVRLISTTDPYTKLVPGTEGTVTRVRENGFGMTISVNWDDGSTLSMLPDEGDRITRI